MRHNPYVGPKPFKAGQKLCGRDREIATLADRLVPDRIVLLHSPSGAGKTSLIQAGLLPKLKEGGFRVLPVARVGLPPPKSPDDNPGNRYVLSFLQSLEEDRAEADRVNPTSLGQITIAHYLQERLAPLRERDGQLDLDGADLIIIDQFEEVLTVEPDNLEAKKEFFGQLGAALKDEGLWALLVIREDWLGALDPYLRDVPTQLRSRFRLDLLRQSAAREAILQPADAAEVKFGEGVVDNLVMDLAKRGPYVEQVQLQLVCWRLWEQLPEDKKIIDEADVQKLGDVNRALRSHYGEQVALVAQETQVREWDIREWFDKKLITAQGLRGQVLLDGRSADGLDEHVLRKLENAFLVRAEPRRGMLWYELVHDRLVEPVRASNREWFARNQSLRQFLANSPRVQVVRRWAGRILVLVALAGLAWAALRIREYFFVEKERFERLSEKERKKELEHRRLLEQGKENLARDFQAQSTDYYLVKAELARLQREDKEVKEAFAQLKLDDNAVKAELAQLKLGDKGTKRDLTQVTTDANAVVDELQRTQVELSRVKAELAQLKLTDGAVKAELAQLKLADGAKKSAIDQLQLRYKTVLEEFAKLKDADLAVQAALAKLTGEHNSLKAAHEKLKLDYTALKAEFEQLKLADTAVKEDLTQVTTDAEGVVDQLTRLDRLSVENNKLKAELAKLKASAGKANTDPAPKNRPPAKVQLPQQSGTP